MCNTMPYPTAAGIRYHPLQSELGLAAACLAHTNQTFTIVISEVKQMIYQLHSMLELHNISVLLQYL